MMTTSLFHHKPATAPFKGQDSNIFFRTSYYGSVGRPSNGRRKSAVELLQESKARYVKSESVLDAKQEFKNAEHLQVRSPTLEVGGGMANNRSLSSLPLPSGSGTFPFTLPCPTCPPYPHQHLDQYSDYVYQHHYLTAASTIPGKIQSSYNKIEMKKNNENRSMRRSIPPPVSLPLPVQSTHIQIQKQEGSSASVTTSNPIGPPVLSVMSHGHILTSNHYMTSDSIHNKKDFAQIPVISSNHTSKQLSGHNKLSLSNESPPPLPPKSPRTINKPSRPQDFPEKLNQSKFPPGRRGPIENSEGKFRKALHDRSNHETYDTITLPSPILPPTPPKEHDLNPESPMSDSGPIISPPPAFSTPVTPMLERQNSVNSEKVSKHPSGLPLPATSLRLRKSVPNLSESSFQYSPQSSSTSSSSPEGRDGDDDESLSINGKSVLHRKVSPPTLQKPTGTSSKIIPKSITENFLCNVANSANGAKVKEDGNNNLREGSVNPQSNIKVRSVSNKIIHNGSSTLQPVSSSFGHGVKMTSMTQTHHQTLPPMRRPILRSKSDLSHRYMKAGKTSTLFPTGFTLVQVDFGPQAAQPASRSISSHDFNSRKVDRNGDVPPSPPPRKNSYSSNTCPKTSKSSSELEKFFDSLGMDSLDGLDKNNEDDRGSSESPVFFSSVSSMESGPRKSGSVDSGDSPTAAGYKFGTRTIGPSIVVQHGEPSIVERNARVIKWLFNCRKAMDK